MDIIDDFKSYIDGNGLNSPQPGSWASNQSGSDNGTMYTSEMYIILKKNGQLTVSDELSFEHMIDRCIGPEGLLNRVPVGQNDGQDGPDNILAVLNGCIELKNTDIPRTLFWACIKYLGFLNNVNPGTKTLQSFLVRQPQLVAAMVSAAFPSLLNPFHWLIRILSFPVYFVAAGSIAISCIGTPTGDTDSRRLAWHLQNNTKKTSFMCLLASLIWLRRLAKDYPNKMNDVAAIYYNPKGLDQNPYSKWWVT